jgi:translation initiation factor 1
MKRDRIPVSAPQSGLQSPFAALEVAGLPAPAPVAALPGKTAGGRVVLRREKAHRGGKTVVVVSDFAPAINSSFIEDLARRARQRLGCGGTARDRRIELQGDRAPEVRAFFESEGFIVAGP